MQMSKSKLTTARGFIVMTSELKMSSLKAFKIYWAGADSSTGR